MRRIPSRLLAALIVSLASAAVAAADWPGWRGPTGLGYSDDKDLPLTWSAKTGDNILWKTLLHGGRQKGQDFTSPGWSSPIVWKDRVFITTATFPPGLDQQARKSVIAEHHVLCFDVKDGQQLWDTVVPPGKLVTLVEDVYRGYAVPTPCTDGTLVFALFGSGVLAALDQGGKIVWREELPRRRDTDPGVCSSPILYEDTVIVPALQDGGLRALDKRTGKLKWQQNIQASNTKPTPALIRVKDRLQLIHHAGGIMGCDPQTGAVLWKCRAPTAEASPVFGDGWLYAGDGQKGAAIDPTGAGDVSKTHVRWESRSEGVGGRSAIFVDGHVYSASGENVLGCWSMKTGELVHEISAPRISRSASPIATPDGRVYWASPGRSYVLKAMPKLEVLATNDIDDGADHTSAAISAGRIYIKGRSHLWCIGKK
jgi:outer membrane protein assembly factor BamB